MIRRSDRIQPCDDGFTVLELLVSLGILFILVRIAVPNWGPLVSIYQLNAASRQVSTELQSARNRSMATYRNYRVVFNSTTTYQIEREQTPGAGNYSLLSGPRSLPGGITATVTTTPVFQPRGNAVSAATITLTSLQGTTKQVTVNIAGKIDLP
jgi:type II secretory pathway pseudopilin PulG